MDVWSHEASLEPAVPNDRVFENYIFGELEGAATNEEAAKSTQQFPVGVNFHSFEAGGKIDFVVKLPPEFEIFDLSVPDGSLDFVSVIRPFSPLKPYPLLDFGHARIPRT
jgi:hypothetical protein